MKATKVIFLDIDGVITSARTGWYNLDIYAINYLRWLCSIGNIKIVISSTWRYNHDAEFWKTIFGEYMHDDYKTPNKIATQMPGFTRGAEIQAWIDKHPELEDYIILDDDSDMLPDQGIHFIQTSGINGIQFCDMDRLKEYFKIEYYPNQNDELYIHENMFATKSRIRNENKRLTNTFQFTND